MPSVKITFDIPTGYKLHQRSLQLGVSQAEVGRRALDQYLGRAPVAEAAIEQHQVGDTKQLVGAYLSDALATAIERLATETRSSKSHVLRDLVRCELRRRGLMPPSTPAPAAAEMEAAA